MSAIVVNLFGAPGAGKSTGAAYIFSILKMNGINAELVTEFAKDKVWEETKAVFRNQAYIFGKQSFRLSRCADKVDVIITDSPLPLSIYYNNTADIKNSFNDYVLDVFNSFNNKNYYLTRVKEYNPIGRFQNEAESDKIGNDIRNLLNNFDIEYTCVNGEKEGYELIANDLLNYFADKHNIEKNDKGELKMLMTEVQQDLFTVPQGYYLAHCISGDYALGAGIAKKFDEVYNMRFKLHRDYAIPEGQKSANVGRALLVDNVFNLVTKERCFHKPTYDELYNTLIDMREQCEDFGVKRLAMPLIGCGLDKFEWSRAKDIIEDVFGSTVIEILICKL